jgi:amino acid adenylation domain-containing protein
VHVRQRQDATPREVNNQPAVSVSEATHEDSIVPADTCLHETRSITPVYDRARLVVPYPSLPFPREALAQSVQARFEQQAARYADHLAVRTPSASLTYAALNRAANRLAHAILRHCAPDQARVALLLRHDAPLIVAVLATLKAGKVFVPLDPEHPEARSRFILEDVAAEVILTDNKHHAQAAALAGGQQTVVNVDALPADLPTRDPGLPVDPSSLAYILYTSGSTGQPKGIMQDHATLLHIALRCTNTFHVSADDRLTLLASCTYAAAMTDIFPALLNGAALYPFEVKRYGIAALATWLRRQEITFYHSVPSLFRRLTDSLGASGQLPSVRLVRLDGDTVYPQDVERYRRHFGPHCLLVNVLGAAEVSVCRRYFVDRVARLDGEIVPVGYPVEDMEVSVLDEDGHPAPVGQAGRITIQSAYLARGYWGRPDWTAAAFQPCQDGSGRRVIQTGDLGYLDTTGCLHYVGRVETLVKVNGRRVEVGTVEARLLEHPHVKQAAVAPRTDPSGDTTLVGYVVADAATGGVTVSELRAFLSSVVPSHMIPAQLVFLDRLPLSANGKLDRQALPDPAGERPRVATTLVAPQEDIEARLVAIWEALLGVSPIGVSDSFFELGGDSLQAIHLCLEILTTFGVDIPPSAIFPQPTIAHIAALIREYREGAASVVVPIQPTGTKPPLFFVHGGGGYVTSFHELAWRLGADQPFYGIQGYGLDGKVPPLTSIYEMATRYIEAVLDVQPVGPYYLAGFSLGGVIAFEMAQQLQQAGEAIALLALVDSFAPGSGYREPQWSRGWLARLARTQWYWPLEWLQRRGDLHPRSIRRRYQTVMRTLRHVRQALHSPASTESARAAEHAAWVHHLRAFKAAWAQGLATYTPTVYPGRIDLFRARRQWLRCTYEPLMGWGALATDGVEVRPVSGHHNGLFLEPHVRGFAREFRRCLADARRSQAPRAHASRDAGRGP